MRVNLVRFLVSVVMGAPAVFAHDVITTKITWTREISRIFYIRCMDCHGPSSPVALTTYDEARPWAKAIRDEVQARRMPPWGAVPGFGSFRPDFGLTQPELDMIVAWVEGGAPKGDDAYLSGLPVVTPPVPEASSPRGGFESTGETVLARAVTLAGIEPRGTSEGGWLQAVAILPSGEVKPLVWVRGYRQQFHRIYWFREPLPLPAKTQLKLFGDKGAGGAFLYVQPPG